MSIAYGARRFQARNNPRQTDLCCLLSVPVPECELWNSGTANELPTLCISAHHRHRFVTRSSIAQHEPVGASARSGAHATAGFRRDSSRIGPSEDFLGEYRSNLRACCGPRCGRQGRANRALARDPSTLIPGEAGRGSLPGQATEEQRRLAEPVCPACEKTSERVLY